MPPPPLTNTHIEMPRLLSGSFLKIPLEWNVALPEQHDAWNGRIVTFLEGPLKDISFPIVRYLGEMDPASGPPEVQFSQSLQYSILIDLASAKEQIVTVGTTTGPLSQWIASSSGSNLCYAVPTGVLGVPFPLLINSVPRNSFGSGIDVAAKPFGTSSTPQAQLSGSALGIASLRHLAPPNSLLPAGSQFRTIAMHLLQNYSHTSTANSGFFPLGDADEGYDAPDASDFHLAYRRANATNGDGIIPSFHRPSVINYVYSTLVNDIGDLQSFTLPDLLGTIELLHVRERAATLDSCSKCSSGVSVRSRYSRHLYQSRIYRQQLW